MFQQCQQTNQFFFFLRKDADFMEISRVNFDTVKKVITPLSQNPENPSRYFRMFFKTNKKVMLENLNKKNECFLLLV